VAGTAETWAAAEASFAQAVAIAAEAPAEPSMGPPVEPAPPARVEASGPAATRKVATGKAGPARGKKRRPPAPPAAQPGNAPG
jgi:hypothetical protein